MKKGYRTYFLFFILVTITFFFHFLLLEKEYRWSFNPGDEGNITAIKQFYDFFENPGKNTLPHGLSISQTYLNGPYIFSAITAHFSEYLVTTGILSKNILLTDESLFIFSFKYTNLIFYSLTVGLVFLCLNHILSHQFLSFGLTLIVFMLNLISVRMGMMLVDIYLLFSSVLFFYTSFRLISNPKNNWNYFWFGLAFILSAATKPNTPVFLNIPGILIVMFFIRHIIDIKKTVLLATTIFLFSFLFFINWYAYPANILSFFRDLINEGKIWFIIADTSSYLYYHFGIFLKQLSDLYAYSKLLSILSALSVIIYLSCVLISFIYILYRIKNYHRNILIFFLIIFLIHSVGLIAGPKFLRYGVLMPYYYLIFIGFGISYFNSDNKETLSRIIITLCLICPFIFNGCNYMFRLKESKNAVTAFNTLKEKPRQWILENVRQGSKIAKMDRYTSPSIPFDQYDLSPDFLTMPWGNVNQMISKIPPDKETLINSTHIVLLSNAYNIQRRKTIERLVLQTSDNGNSGSFKIYLKQLDELSPRISNKYYEDNGKYLDEELFYRTILSEMWNDNITFERSLINFYNSVSDNIDLIEDIVDNAVNILFQGNSNLLHLKYADFISSSGKMMVAYAWSQFYEDIANSFESIHFESDFEYKQVKWQKIIIINNDCLISPEEIM